jgi:superfamily II DNA or RNA helicase
VPIPFALTRLFSSSSRVRGDAYAREGRVQLITVTPTAIDALVRGTDTYSVHLTYEPGQPVQALEMACTCPYYFDGPGTCKHIWAALLVAANHPGTFVAAMEDNGSGSRPVAPWIDDLDSDGTDDGFAPAGRRRSPHATAAAAARRPPVSPGRRFLAAVASGIVPSSVTALPLPDRQEELIYILNLHGSQRGSDLSIGVMTRRPRKSGGWTQPRPPRMLPSDLHSVPPEDAEILSALVGATHASGGYGAYALQYALTVPPALARIVVPLMAKTGRTFVRVSAFESEPLLPVVWDDGAPWTFEVTAEARGAGQLISGVFVRGDQRLAPGDWLAVLESGFLVTRTTIARAALPASRALATALLASGPVELSPEESTALAETLAQTGTSSPDLPAPLRVPDVDVAPVRRMSLSKAQTWDARDQLAAAISFDYDGTLLPPSIADSAWDAAKRRLIRRRTADETAALERLASLGVTRRWDPIAHAEKWFVSIAAMPRLVRTLVSEGWRVEAEGKLVQRASRVTMSVSSGIDWFDLHASVEFAGETVPLNDVLDALKRGESSVRLGDGSVGLLPEEWLARYAPFAAMGDADGDRLRFRLPQTTVLDALLAAQADDATITIDQTFEAARREMARFDRIAPADAPASFRGELRPYQKDGLGWLAFLRRFNFGGCLADDMGLGKTVMVLAMLDAWRRDRPQGDPPRPSLVVVPRSVVYNWIAEAARFSPELRVRDFSHASRKDAGEAWDDVDLAIATYGTMRRDIGELKDREFDYVILDEAQAIKNASTASAKAARLLRGRHRLALSGTPIENHLGELWSLLEFLNPGMLGRSNVFATIGSVARTVDPDTTALLARAVRPFILRRTKGEVATDLPPRTEQTIICELEGKQRTLYNSLRAHYRDALLGRIDRVGLSKSKLQVLEALLRLRQAACHPGLVDATAIKAPSAKLDALLPKLREVVDEGHKTIVFSQFTSFLAIVREALEKEGLVYEYLDGRTRDRAARVERFQTDPACGVFLVSLKAGGLGLNLTAAEYVFLLDPWWNPAVEAQAIDRAHRIGQTRHVFAYRLIARDTVEEKVLELQQTKRSLADAIQRADAGLIGQLGREDLELLLS